MSIPLDERCATCKFCAEIPLYKLRHPEKRWLGNAVCLRYPPNIEGSFPEIEATGCWCGEWKGE